MAFCASKGAIVAVICVLLVVSWVGEPAQASPSCAVHRCISECPSKCNEKAASSCEGAKGFDEARCKRGCIKSCTDINCRSSGDTICDCDSKCDSYCKGNSGPAYNGCVAAVFQSCKDSCEKGCNGEKGGN